MTKRKEEALKTRQKILDGTYELLLKNKFEDLNIDEITKFCNVAKGTFYTYFDHKEDIVFEICRPSFKRIEEEIKNMKDKNFFEKISFYFDEFMKEVQKYGVNITRSWIKGVIDPKKAPKTYDNKKWEYDTEMLKNILNFAIKNNELKEDAPLELLTHIIISELYGMMTIWCMSDEKFNPLDWTKKFCDLELKNLFKDYIKREK